MLQKDKTYLNPFKFTSNFELLTFTVVGAFITWKFINALYEDLYEPIMDYIMPDTKCQKNDIVIKKIKFKVGFIIKEIIKWFILILILMVVHNIIHILNR